MSLDYATQPSHVIRIETKHYNNAAADHNSIAGYSSVRLFWDLTINISKQSAQATVEPEDISDASNTATNFIGTDDGDIKTDHAQYTFNVDENQTNIDIGKIRSFFGIEYFFFNGTESYNEFSLVQNGFGTATLHYDGLINYEKQSQYEVELWGQIQDVYGEGTGWSKISVTINVINDSTEAPEFYTDEYVFKLPHNYSDTNNGIYMGTVKAKGEDGETVSYSFSHPNAVNNFTLNSITGEISYIGTGTSEGDIQYLSVVATDTNGETAQTEVFITQDGLHDITETNTNVDEVLNFGENLTSSTATGTITVDGTSSYYIYGDDNGFSIESSTGILNYDGPEFNYEVDDKIVNLTIYVVSNDVLMDIRYIEVNIIDAEDPINLPDSLEFTLPENTSDVEIGIITATDEDVEDSFTYEFLNGTNTYNHFTLDTNTGALTYVGYELDYEINNQIVDEFQVLARSAKGDIKITNVTVSLSDLPEGVITTQSFDPVWTVRAGVAEVYDVNVSEYFTNLNDGDLIYKATLDGQSLSEYIWLHINAITGVLSVTDAAVQNNNNQTIIVHAINKHGLSTTQDIQLSVGHLEVPTPSGDLFADVDEDISASDILYDIETDDTSLIGPNSFIEYYINNDPSGLFEIADYLTGEVTLQDGMSLDYDTQSSHVIRIETRHYNNAAVPHNSIPGRHSVRLFWDLTINVNLPPRPPEIIIEPEGIHDTSNINNYFFNTDSGDVNTRHAQYTFNVDENETNIDIGRINASSNVEYFFYNSTQSYRGFSLVQDPTGHVILHYDGLTNYETQNQYKLKLWGQIHDAAGVATGWSKISVTINVDNDSTEAPEFYTDVYVFKLSENISGTNGIYVGQVKAKGEDGDTVTYSFSNPNAVRKFTLNSVTGEISYIGAGTSEGDIQYLSITATGSNGETTETGVFITQDAIHDVTQANRNIGGIFNFVENITSSAAIGTITVDGTSSYYIYGDNNGFSIDSTTGILSYDGEGHNHEADAVVPITIYAVSNDLVINIIHVDVNIIDIEEALDLPDSYELSLYENTSDVEIGIITAIDEDVEDTITYEFLNGTNIYNGFTLDTNTGALTYVGYELDYETDDEIVDEFQVLVHSSDGEVKITDVRVSLGNIYEGVITTQSFDAVWTVRAGVAEVYDVNVSEYFTNLDDGDLTYTASIDYKDSSEYDWWNINTTTGALSVRNNIVQNNDNQIITVTATNEYGLSTTQDIKLSVGATDVPTPSGDLFANVDEDVSATKVLYDIETDDTSLIGPNSAIEYFILDDPSGLFEIADYDRGEVTLKDGMSLDYDTQSSHVIRIETKHYNDAAIPHNSIPAHSSIRLFWDLTINVNNPEIIVEPEDINDPSNITAYFVDTDDGDVNTKHAQYTFNVDENQTNIDIGQISSSSYVEYFFYNTTKSYNGFSLVEDSAGIVTLHYAGLTDYETQNQYEVEIWGQIQDDVGEITGWTKISVIINVNDDGIINAPEFYTDEYSFKLPENVSDTNNGIYVGSVAAKDDAGNSISYSFSNPNAVNDFTLNSTTGEISYIGTGENFELKTQHNFSVIATSNDGTDIADVNINVVNMIEAPIPVTNDTYTFNEGTNFLIETFEIDPENNNLTFSARLAEGSSLLDWMLFDTITGELSGEAPQVSNDTSYSIVMKVIEEDSGHVTNNEFEILIIDII